MCWFIVTPKKISIFTTLLMGGCYNPIISKLMVHRLNKRTWKGGFHGQPVPDGGLAETDQAPLGNRDIDILIYHVIIHDIIYPTTSWIYIYIYSICCVNYICIYTYNYIYTHIQYTVYYMVVHISVLKRSRKAGGSWAGNVFPSSPVPMSASLWAVV